MVDFRGKVTALGRRNAEKADLRIGLKLLAPQILEVFYIKSFLLMASVFSSDSSVLSISVFAPSRLC